MHVKDIASGRCELLESQFTFDISCTQTNKNIFHPASVDFNI